MHVVAHAEGDAVAQREVARQCRPPQVEVSILQPQLLGRVDFVVDGERRRLRAIEDLDGGGDDFDVTGGDLRIARLRVALGDFALDANDELGARFLRCRNHGLAGAARAVDDHLHHAAAVAHVDEDELTEVALLLHPAFHFDGLARVFFAKCSGVGAIHR